MTVIVMAWDMRMKGLKLQFLGVLVQWSFCERQPVRFCSEDEEEGVGHEGDYSEV